MADKSKRIIKDALLQLMKNHNFTEITVAEICAWADIARSTFYNHFETKEDVILWTSQSIVIEYLDNYICINDKWVESVIYYFFEQSYKYKDYLSLLSKHKLFYIHREALLEITFTHKNITTQSLYLDLPEYMRRFLVRAYTDSALSFFEEWESTDFALPIDKITEMYIDIIHHPN